MRRIVVSEFMSVDGVMEDPGGSEGFERGGWAFQFDRGAEGDKFKLDETMASDALLLGRVTYDGFAPVWPQFEGEFAPTIIASAYGEVKGVPAIFPRKAFPELHALDGDRGARGVILHPPCAVITLPFEGGEVDIDLPRDIAKLE